MSVTEALRHRGADVTLLERTTCGSGASRGNAGWITPSHALPLPAPGVVALALRWLPDPAGPLRLHPSLAMVPWSWSFWRHARPGPFRAGAQALQQFAATAVGDLLTLRERIAPFELHECGLIYAAATEDELHHVRAELETLREAGHAGHAERVELLDAAAARAHEPAFGTTGAPAGAIVMHGEAQVRPETLAAALRTALVERGVDVRERADVRGLWPVGSGWRAETSDGAVEAAAVVIAAGADAPAVARQAGLRLPLQAAKGYSATFARTPDAPRSPIYLHGAKIAISPYHDGVRVSGMLELGASGLSPSLDRIERFVRRAAAALPGWRPSDAGEPWAGAPPAAGRGCPRSGRSPRARACSSRWDTAPSASRSQPRPAASWRAASSTGPRCRRVSGRSVSTSADQRALLCLTSAASIV